MKNPTIKSEETPSRGGEHKSVFIVEDHPVFREGLVHLLEGEKGLKLCGAAGDAFAARRDIERLKPDLVLLDISLPGKSGLELLKELRAVARQPKVLVISMHDEAVYANRVLRLGADGYIMKKEDPEEIVQAIRDVLSGHIYVSENVLSGPDTAGKSPRPARAANRLAKLTDAELELLELLGEGKTHDEIGALLRLTPEQSKAVSEEIRKKLGLNTENALIRYAVCWVETGRA